MRKFAIALLVLAGLAAAGYFGVDAYAQREAERQVAAAFGELEAGGTQARFGTVDYDLMRGRFAVADIAIETPGNGLLKIGSFVATGLDRPAPYRMFAERVEVRDLSFDGPLPLAPQITGSYRVPQIDLDKFEGPAAFEASGAPWSVLLGVLEQISADRIDIPGATSSTRVDGVRTDAQHGALHAEWFNRGAIKTLTVAPSQFTVSDDTGRKTTGTVGKLSAERIDLVPFLAMLDPDRRKTQTEFVTVYGAVDIEGYEVKGEPGVGQTWRALAIREVAVKPSALPVDELMALGQRLQQLSAGGRTPPSSDVAAALDTISGLYDGLRIGGVDFNGMTMSQPGASDVTLGAMRIGALEDGRLASFALERFAGTDADGRVVKIDRLAIDGLRPGELMRYGARSLTDPAAMRTLSRQLAALRMIEAVDIAGLEAPAGPLEDDVVKLDALKLSWSDFVGEVPTRIAATLRITGPIDTLTAEEPFSLLAANGATRATVAFDGGLNWNEADKSYVLSPFAVEVGDAFSASAKVTLTGVDRASFLAAGQADGLDAVLAANLGPAEITLTDTGLYTLKLKQVAEEQGASPEAVQQLTLGIAQMIAQPVMEERPELQGTIQAILDFLAEPKGTLNVKITPRRSLPLITVLQAANGDPASLLDAVDIEATATR